MPRRTAPVADSNSQLNFEALAWGMWVTRASAAPTAGNHVQGEIVLNTAPASAGFIGWVCTASGSPGTWKTWGVIS